LHTPLLSEAGSNSAFVSGDYNYWHYLLDGFDDRGWGCAYRSGQTLISWFLLNGWSLQSMERMVTILAMQEILVAVDGKDPKFVGSRDWIGSFELALIIEHLLGVQSKILSVNCGDEVNGDVCEQLLQHFNAYGTPVMCGGAVGGAITIIGIDTTPQRRSHTSMSNGLDNARFLMLDPHYVGGDDDPDMIIACGHWCYWIDARCYFEPGAFYNFCMPQATAGNGTSLLKQDYEKETTDVKEPADGWGIQAELSGEAWAIETVSAGFGFP
jgi:hypothetical protein